MASSHGNTHSEPAIMEQIITEFFAKSLHIILESRCPYVSSRNYSGEQVFSSPSPSSSSSSSCFRPRDKWFNLALKDCPAALENIDFWRQSNLEPMIVDVVLTERPNDWDPLNFSPKRGLVRNSTGKERHCYGSDNEEFGCEAKNEKILERWVLQYESKKIGGNCSGTKRSTCTSSHSLYKKSILLLRSLYATVRLLPAYKLFRDLISSAQIRLYNLSHRVSSFVEPFTRKEEADMQRFVFTPVDTSCGRLCLSVMYRSSTLDLSSEPSTPISPQFIQEYVGSPMAEPLKRVPSGSSPFGRRHSWSYDLYRASPPSVNPSPSPTYSEPHALLAKQQANRLPPASVPRNLHDETHMKTLSYDEYWPSPIFSPSTSPSPPACTLGGHISKGLLRCESAPVSIPASKLRTMPSHPSPPMKATKLTVSKQIPHSGLNQTRSNVDKLFPISKDEPGKMLVAKQSSNSSPSNSVSSRFSFQDDYDDSEFPGHFVVDDDDTIDRGSRPSSFDLSGPASGTYEPVKKSQDAAVGALVCMLKKAPPLGQDMQDLHVSKLVNNETSQEPIVQQSTSSNLAASRTTADALDELREYRKMKDLLMKQGKISRA